MNDWQKYTEGRLILERDDYYIIKPEEPIEVIPLSCEVCKTLYKGVEDELSHRNFKCCRHCAREWAEANRKKWNEEGWRPSNEEIMTKFRLRQKRTVKFTLSA